MKLNEEGKIIKPNPKSKGWMLKVAVVGAGPAGLFCAYEYARLGAQVTVFERGRQSHERVCPDVDCKTCPFKTDCAILCGEGGAGGFSDGKVTLSAGRGVQVGDFDLGKYADYLPDVEFICELYGENSEFFHPVSRPACLKGTEFAFESYPLRFYGTEGIRKMFANMGDHMQENLGVKFWYETPVTGLHYGQYPKESPNAPGVSYLVPPDGYGKVDRFDRVVFATGSFSSDFMKSIAQHNNIKLSMGGPAGIGIRLEAREGLMEPIMSEFYDFKLYLDYEVSGMPVQFRSFCVNRGGSIVNENRTGSQPIVSINGRSELLTTGRSNLAVLAKIPAGKELVKGLARTVNIMAKGLPGVQSARRFVRDDVFSKLYLAEEESRYFAWGARIRNSNWADVITAFPPDLGRGFQKYLLELEKAMPGVVYHPTSLVYAPEVKYHMPRWPITEGFEVEDLPNVQVIGNAGGYTDSISTAAVMGLAAARHIME